MNVSGEDEAIETALRDLPRWQASADFAQRLAAAAARQHREHEAPRPTSGAARLLRLANRLVPWTVGSGVAASVLADLPWDALSRNPGGFGGGVAALIAAVGLRMTVRLLRS